jgi:hypothetical protein
LAKHRETAVGVTDFCAVSAETEMKSKLTAPNNAVAATGGSTVYFPLGVQNYTYARSPTNFIWEFGGPMVNRGKVGLGTTVNFRTGMYGVMVGNYPTTHTTLHYIGAVADGSEANFVHDSDTALEVRVEKEIGRTRLSLKLARLMGNSPCVGKAAPRPE